MKEFISLDVLLNWVEMLRANIDGAIVLADDEEESRFYERLIHPSAKVIPAFDVADVLLERLTELGIEGVIAVGRRTPGAHLLEGTVCPTLGDVSSLLLNSSACQGVISDVCGKAWIEAGEKEVGAILTRIVDLARLFNQLRVVAQENRKALTIQQFINAIEWKTLKVNLVKLHPFGGDAQLTAIAEALIESFTIMPLKEGLTECDGTDAIYILAAATHFLKPRGISAARNVEAAELLGLLRVSFQFEEFENDQFFWRLKKWERQNSRYPLLGDWRELDSLETVWDQRYWQRDLEKLLEESEPGQLLAVLKMDLDNFKRVNDELGHSAGDDAIRHYCSVVKSIVGNAGYVYRRGGDEVVALLPETDGPTAGATAEKIRSQLESTFRLWADERGLKESPTASIGVVIYGGRSPLEVVELADKAQREAKDKGKNRVVVAALGQDNK
jgi:diguanylate cyclase (GGDEF)-like protein